MAKRTELCENCLGEQILKEATEKFGEELSSIYGPGICSSCRTETDILDLNLLLMSLQYGKLKWWEDLEDKRITFDPATLKKLRVMSEFYAKDGDGKISDKVKLSQMVNIAVNRFHDSIFIHDLTSNIDQDQKGSNVQ